MYYLKSCPRCHVGDIFKANDEYGPYVACFQCGYVGYDDLVLPVNMAAAELKHRGKRW